MSAVGPRNMYISIYLSYYIAEKHMPRYHSCSYVHHNVTEMYGADHSLQQPAILLKINVTLISASPSVSVEKAVLQHASLSEHELLKQYTKLGRR